MVRAGRCVGPGVGLAAAALLITGCGVDVPGSEADLTTPPTTATARATPAGAQPPTTDAAGPEFGPQFPLTLRRTGGVAGFDDTVVLRADGRLLVDTRAVHGRVCTLVGTQLRQLVGGLSTLRLGPLDTATAGGPAPDAATGPTEPITDPITISVTDDRSRAIDLTDPSVGEVAGLVGALVSDVTLTDPATTRCADAPAS